MSTILVTGVTGTVMNPLCARLLEAGHTILALVRPTKGDPKERLLGSLDVSKAAKNRLVVLVGDITEELGGIAPEELRRWSGKVQKLVHGAANIKFQETKDNQVFNTNVNGTRNILRLATELDIPEFHHISTIYVVGDGTELSEHDTRGGTPRNAYEHSKLQAEQEVRQSSIPWSIYRIPIVVGDSRTGAIQRFTGYYSFLAFFWRLRKATLKRKEQGVELPEGLWFDRAQNLHVPVAVPCSNDEPANLVPVDWLTEKLEQAVNSIPPKGCTLHLLHEQPPRIREIMRVSLEGIGVKGVRYGEEPSSQNGILRVVQRTLTKELGHYNPYLLKGQHFQTEATICEFERSGIPWTPAPMFTPALVSRLLKYAMTRNFEEEMEPASNAPSRISASLL